MENKNITYLNSKAWYRFLKVIFIITVLLALLIMNGVLISDGVARIDADKSLINCTRGEKRTVSFKRAGIYFNNYDLVGFDYKNFYEGYYNDYKIKDILIACYDISSDIDIFAMQRAHEIANKLSGDKKELTEADKQMIDKEIKQMTEGYKTNTQKASYLDYSFKLFELKPIYTYTEFIKYFVLGNIIIFLFFEISRRVFYYIVLGTLRPRKNHTG